MKNNMQSKAQSPEDYIEEIQEERRPYFEKLRKTILNNIPDGFSEEMSYWMIGYVVPHNIYPDWYHCKPELPLPFISIANQKWFIALYHMWIYANKELEEWFVGEYKKVCKYKLDMWKSCVRFKRMDDIPYDLIKELVKKISVDDWIETYEKNVKN